MGSYRPLVFKQYRPSSGQSRTGEWPESMQRFKDMDRRNPQEVLGEGYYQCRFHH